MLNEWAQHLQGCILFIVQKKIKKGDLQLQRLAWHKAPIYLVWTFWAFIHGLVISNTAFLESYFLLPFWTFLDLFPPNICFWAAGVLRGFCLFRIRVGGWVIREWKHLPATQSKTCGNIKQTKKVWSCSFCRKKSNRWPVSYIYGPEILTINPPLVQILLH